MSEQDEIFERATETPIALAPSQGGKVEYCADVAVANCQKVMARSNRKAKREVAE